MLYYHYTHYLIFNLSVHPRRINSLALYVPTRNQCVYVSSEESEIGQETSWRIEVAYTPNL